CVLECLGRCVCNESQGRTVILDRQDRQVTLDVKTERQHRPSAAQSQEPLCKRRGVLHADERIPRPLMLLFTQPRVPGQILAPPLITDLAELSINSHYATLFCRRPIKMSPLCKVEVTLPGFWGPGRCAVA